MIRHLRFHGRGGIGARLASRIVSRTAFLAGYTVQDSPIYGAERRGAPVVAFTRFAPGPIQERGYVENPDVLVVMDESLLATPEAGVLEGVDAGTLVLVNSARDAATLRAQVGVRGRIATLDLSALALALLGEHVLSAPAAGFTVKATALAPWDALAEAVRVELGEARLAEPGLVTRNLAAARRAFDAAPVFGLRERVPPPVAVAGHPFVIPRLPARIAAPSVSAAATSALRTTEGWRVYRPEIDLTRCTRCFLCFALCPEGAIALDADNYPIIDYEHCKGCLVCVHECPPDAIKEVREERA